MAGDRKVHLVVVHYHLRPGGARRVLELSLPEMVRTGRIGAVTFLCGEGSPEWVEALADELCEVPVDLVEEPAVGYWSEMTPEVRAAAEARLKRRLHSNRFQNGSTIFWAHNPALGRNLLLAQALGDLAAEGFRVLFHHHDLWLENRWERCREMIDAGFESPEQLMAATLPDHVVHVAINRKVAAEVGGEWLPNPVERLVTSSAPLSSKAWLARHHAVDGPYWIYPVRMLRRKNIAEAILLTRWLRPDHWLITTGSISSDAERAAAFTLMNEARAGRWRTAFAVLARNEGPSPGPAELVAGAEAVVVTSTSEGFGLPFIEAPGLGRPLIARRLPAVFVDLATMGFQFNNTYNDILIPVSLFDRRREVDLQRAVEESRYAGIPTSVAAMLRGTETSNPDAKLWPFSRLTLESQLDILRQPPQTTLQACLDANPFLESWRSNDLLPDSWPSEVETGFGSTAFAARFWDIVERASGSAR